MSGVMMWPYIALTLVINTTRLPVHLQPGWPRVVAMWWATAFFGYFSTLLVGRTLANDFGVVLARTDPAVLGSAPGGYALWAGFVLVQVYTMVQTVRAKRRASGIDESVREAARGWLS
jgi:hypothetical protein